MLLFWLVFVPVLITLFLICSLIRISLENRRERRRREQTEQEQEGREETEQGQEERQDEDLEGAEQTRRSEPEIILSWRDRMIVGAPSILISLLLAFGLFVLLVGIRQREAVPIINGSIILLVDVLFTSACLVKIPSAPPDGPYVGLVTIWEGRKPIVKREGYRLLAPFFPFRYKVILIQVQAKDLDFSFSDLRTRAREENGETSQGLRANGGNREEELGPRAGGEILVEISLAYTPDYKSENAGERLISFLDKGGEKGIKDMIEDFIEEDLRELTGSFDWESFTFTRSQIKTALIKKLTGAEAIIPGGLPDVKELGIKILKLTVGRIKEQGALGEAADQFAREQQERRGQQLELEFTEEHTQKFIDMGIDAAEALDAVQVQVGKATKAVTTIRGVQDVGGAFTAGVARYLGGGSPSPAAISAPSGSGSDREKDSAKDKKGAPLTEEQRRQIFGGK